MLITGNSRKFLVLEIHCANDFFAQNDIAKKDFAENSCVELTLLKIFRGNFCESGGRHHLENSLFFIFRKIRIVLLIVP